MPSRVSSSGYASSRSQRITWTSNPARAKVPASFAIRGSRPAGLFERTKTTRTAMSSQERGDPLRDLLPGRAVAERVRPLQIGRASCRERVWISVAGGEGQKRDTVIIATLKLVNDIVYC